MKKQPRGRIEVQGQGISAVSDELLEQRARDLAREDGRTEPRDADFKKAREELSAFTEDPAPEVPLGDESADTIGHKVDTSPPDQDVDVGLELVEEGVDEADEDRRRAAKDDESPEAD